MSTPPPPMAPVPASTPTPPPRRSRTMLYLGVAVAAVIVVLLVAVFVLPSLTSSSSGSSTAVLTYSGAVPIANSAVAGFAGGGWVPIFAAGLVSPTSATYPANSTALGNLTSGCTYTEVTKVSSLTLPGYSGNRSSGAAPAWEFGYRNGSDALAVVSVINGQGSVLATLTGSECSLYAQFFAPIPGDVIDSSAAAKAVEPDAASFLAEYPNASAELGLIGGISFFGHVGPEWSVMYSTCALSESPSGTGAQFNATVNALTGVVYGHNSSTDVSCGGSGSTEVVRAASPFAVGMPSAVSLRERSSGPS